MPPLPQHSCSHPLVIASFASAFLFPSLAISSFPLPFLFSSVGHPFFQSTFLFPFIVPFLFSFSIPDAISFLLPCSPLYSCSHLLVSHSPSFATAALTLKRCNFLPSSPRYSCSSNHFLLHCSVILRCSYLLIHCHLFRQSSLSLSWTLLFLPCVFLFPLGPYL